MSTNPHDDVGGAVLAIVSFGLLSSGIVLAQKAATGKRWVIATLPLTFLCGLPSSAAWVTCSS